METMVLATVFAAIVVYVATVLACVLRGQGSRVPTHTDLKPHSDLKDSLEEITFPLLLALCIGAVVSWNRGVDVEIISAGVLAGVLGLVLVHISFRVYGYTQKVREDRRERPGRKVPDEGIDPEEVRRKDNDPHTPVRMM